MIEYLLFIVILLGFVPLLYLTLKSMVFKGKWEYVIFFLLAFLPIYITILSITYQATNEKILVSFFQIIKDVLVILACMLFILYQKNIFEYRWRLTRVDKLYAVFIGLAFVYMLLPLGETSFGNKVLYFKNMLIPALVYFIGRNTVFDDKEVSNVFRIIFIVAIAAFVFNLLEGILDTHLQNFTGYAHFIQGINEIEISGNFGLQWTFETQAITKRFASFFADPLELASSILLGFSAGLIWYLTSKREHSFLYILVMSCSIGSLLFSSSRAAFASFFILVFFVAMVFKLYKLILFGFSAAMLFVVFVLFFASEDFYIFVVDTLTFQNASSVGHVIDWLAGIESMMDNPLGIGLAMSGNVGSVDGELSIGGENQFIIYGVQLGVPGLLIFIMLLAYSIAHSIRVFRDTESVMTARIAFTGAAVKTGLLLPLFTANAEMYAYVSWISWWMIGYSMNHYSKIGLRNEKA